MSIYVENSVCVKYRKVIPNFKVVVRAEILPRDFLQTSGNYYL